MILTAAAAWMRKLATRAAFLQTCARLRCDLLVLCHCSPFLHYESCSASRFMSAKASALLSKNRHGLMGQPLSR